jgi:hypothetical protein
MTAAAADRLASVQARHMLLAGRAYDAYILREGLAERVVWTNIKPIATAQLPGLQSLLVTQFHLGRALLQ